MSSRCVLAQYMKDSGHSYDKLTDKRRGVVALRLLFCPLGFCALQSLPSVDWLKLLLGRLRGLVYISVSDMSVSECRRHSTAGSMQEARMMNDTKRKTPDETMAVNRGNRVIRPLRVVYQYQRCNHNYSRNYRPKAFVYHDTAQQRRGHTQFTPLPISETPPLIGTT